MTREQRRANDVIGIFSPLFHDVFECSNVPRIRRNLLISPNGTLETSHFQFNHYEVKGWWEYNLWGKDEMTAEYIEELKAMASMQGIPTEDVDDLWADGFGFDEIEEYLYGM